MLIGLLLDFDPAVIGVFFFPIALLNHAFFYEIKNRSQYYYYYNLGLSHGVLWLSTVVIGVVNLLILLAI